MNPQQQVSAQALTPPGNKSGQVNPDQVWDHLTPTQQQIVFQSLVLLCQHVLQHLSQTIWPEVQDEGE
jgi:hypothetical protein